jgi:hypothetical protein
MVNGVKKVQKAKDNLYVLTDNGFFNLNDQK